jgi:hypothetical protein
MKAPKNKVPDAESKKKIPKLPERGGRSTKNAEKKTKRGGH